MALDQGSFSATAATSELVAANGYRGYVMVQLTSGDPVSLGLGEAAVFGEGIHLMVVGDFAIIRGRQAEKAINGICGAGNTASGGFQEG